MKHQFSSELHHRFGFYYALLGRDLKLKHDGPALRAYLGCSDAPDEEDIRDVLPELFGYEKDLRAVISGGRQELELTGINRDDNEGICFNLHIINYEYRGHPAIVVVHDVTGDVCAMRSIQQSRNEVILLQHELIDKNSELDAANRALIVSRDEATTLNQELEAKVAERTAELEASYEKARRLFYQTVNSLTQALEIRDPYTAGHQQRVAHLAAAIAEKMRIDRDTVEGIYVAGQLHDIGKIYVPSEFLTKPGVLPEEEYNVIKTHAIMGFEIIKNIEFPWPVAAVILQHHERIDGSGYPYGLEGDEIRLESRILAVADVVEAMSTNRPYRVSPGVHEAIQEITSFRGVKYDREAADACIELFEFGEFRWDD